MRCLVGAVIFVCLVVGGCGGESESSKRDSPAKDERRGVDVEDCLVKAGVEKATNASDLRFVGGDVPTAVVTGLFTDGKAIASFKTRKDYIYVVNVDEGNILGSVVRKSPQSFEFVGVAKAPSERAVASAEDCLNGVIGDGI